jgi:membrane associated rhomboid family serine protease
MDKIPTVTKNLLAINVLMFLALLVGQRWGIDLNDYLGLHFFLSEGFMPHQLITYMFMHGSLSHIFFNMYALFIFGRTLEHVWGPKRFLVYYLVAGVGAALVQEAVGAVRFYSIAGAIDPAGVAAVVHEGFGILQQGKNYINPSLAELNIVLNSTTVGASGAIYAILLGFGMLFPNDRIFIFPLPVPIKAKYFVIGYAVIELYMGVAGSPDGVAHFAHLGGMLFGLILIMLWRKKKKISGPYV